MDLKKMLTKKNIFNGLFVALLLVILFVPSAKAFVLQGLMEIGFLKPTIEKKELTINADLNGIKFKDSKGNVVSLASLNGKVVLINFWATWCPPCLAEMSSLNKLHKQFAEDKEVVFLMVDADSDFGKAQAYMDRKKYQMPVYALASDIPDKLFNGVLPTTLVLDKQGRISYREEGAANYGSQKFIDFIKKLKALKN